MIWYADIKCDHGFLVTSSASAHFRTVFHISSDKGLLTTYHTCSLPRSSLFHPIHRHDRDLLVSKQDPRILADRQSYSL